MSSSDDARSEKEKELAAIIERAKELKRQQEELTKQQQEELKKRKN